MENFLKTLNKDQLSMIAKLTNNNSLEATKDSSISKPVSISSNNSNKKRIRSNEALKLLSQNDSFKKNKTTDEDKVLFIF
jgi:hypothetical protein